MSNLFDLYQSLSTKNNQNYSRELIPNASRIATINNRNIQNIRTYYNDYKSIVSNQNIISNIMRTIDIPFHVPLDRFIDYITDNQLEFLRAFKVVTPINNPNTTTNNFFPDCTEVFQSFRYTHPPYEFTNIDYRTLKPLTIRRSPYTTWDYIVPNGTRWVATSEAKQRPVVGTKDRAGRQKQGGIVVINVDLPLLLIQYYLHYRDQLTKDELALKPQEFIFRYVCPNMVESLYDLTAFNNLIALRDFKEINPTIKKVTIPLTDVSREAENLHVELLKRFDKRKFDVSRVLRNIPTLSANNFLDLILNEEDFYLRQNRWVSFLTRLPVIAFGLKISKGFNTNSIERSYQKAITRVTNDINSIPKGPIRDDFDYWCKEIDDLL